MIDALPSAFCVLPGCTAPMIISESLYHFLCLARVLPLDWPSIGFVSLYPHYLPQRISNHRRGTSFKHFFSPSLPPEGVERVIFDPPFQNLRKNYGKYSGWPAPVIFKKYLPSREISQPAKPPSEGPSSAIVWCMVFEVISFPVPMLDCDLQT